MDTGPLASGVQPLAVLSQETDVVGGVEGEPLAVGGLLAKLLALQSVVAVHGRHDGAVAVT